MIVGQNQTLFDIALQEYGDVMGIFNLMADNGNIISSLNVKLTPGTKLEIAGEVIEKAIVDEYRGRAVRPASSERPIIVMGGVEGDAIQAEDNNLIQTN